MSDLISAVDAFLPGVVCSEDAIPVRWGTRGAAPRPVETMVALCVDLTGVVVNAWSVAEATQLLPLSDRGVGLVVRWDVTPPAKGWDSPAFLSRVHDAIAYAETVILATLAGDLCGATHELGMTCRRPAGHDPDLGHAVTGRTWAVKAAA